MGGGGEVMKRERDRFLFFFLSEEKWCGGVFTEGVGGEIRVRVFEILEEISTSSDLVEEVWKEGDSGASLGTEGVRRMINYW